MSYRIDRPHLQRPHMEQKGTISSCARAREAINSCACSGAVEYSASIFMAVLRASSRRTGPTRDFRQSRARLNSGRVSRNTKNASIQGGADFLPRQSGKGHVAQNLASEASASALAFSASGPMCDASRIGAKSLRSGPTNLRLHQELSWPSRIVLIIARNNTSRARASSMPHLPCGKVALFVSNPCEAALSARRNYRADGANICEAKSFHSNCPQPLAYEYERPSVSRGRSDYVGVLA